MRYVTLERRVDQLLSVREIQELAYRYALAVDSRDLESLVALFVEDVGPGMDSRERDHSYELHPTIGRDALRNWFRNALASFEMSILSVSNHVIDFVDSDHASGVVYCHAEMAVGGEWIAQAIQYRDTYERVGGHWYFQYRQHLMWYSLDAREVPLGPDPVRFPASQRGRGAIAIDVSNMDTVLGGRYKDLNSRLCCEGVSTRDRAPLRTLEVPCASEPFPHRIRTDKR